MSASQYTFRAQKTSGVAIEPSWEPTAQIPRHVFRRNDLDRELTPFSDTAAVKNYAYSPDEEWLAYATASSVQLLPSSSSSTTPSKEIAQTGVVALSFSPLSSTLFTFERPVKSDTDVHKNVKAWDVQSGEEVGSWYQKSLEDWTPLITSDETHMIRSTQSDILFFTPPLAPRPNLRLKIDGTIRGLYLSKPASLPEGTTSVKPVKEASEPALAVWVGEKKGAPASVALYTLSSLLGKSTKSAEGGEEKTETRDMPMTTARKAFYKADKLSIKWNPAGTSALFLTHTDVDASGKSYYGETNLYLVSVDGSFDGLVDLDKEGPIYDFAWNPTSREFAVCYGYMPAKITLFDTKTKPLYCFGSHPRNFISYQPQGKLLLTAGFGNLAGGVDVWDVSTRNKIAEFKASNSSHCEWSPCGRYILTATLSPRLRVDNGVKIWWCGGQLLHIHPQEELYQASFKPVKLSAVQPFPAVAPKAPEPNESVALYRPKGETSNGAEAKPAGAYRPPGARGTAASDAYKRDGDSGPSSGTSTPTPMFKGGKPGQRYVPGQSIPGAPPANTPEDKKKRVRSKRPMKEAAEEKPKENGATNGLEKSVETLKVAEEDDASAKKIRNLNKKLKAIEDLKAKIKAGEQLEKTQLKKIETEAEVRSEIEALGGVPGA